MCPRQVLHGVGGAVGKQMSVQVRLAGVTLAAAPTGERSNVAVRQHVFVQVKLPPQTFSTFWTGVRLFSWKTPQHPMKHLQVSATSAVCVGSSIFVRLLTCVYAAVLGQVTGNGEGLATVSAGVRSLACVRPHVFLQVSARRPAFPTHCACVRALAGVAPHMHVERSQSSEGLGAIGAAVWPLTAVRAQVTLQPIARLEAFAALRAQEAAVRGVATAVGVEARQRCIGFGAKVTDEGAKAVGALMNTQLSHSCKKTVRC